MTSKFLDDGGPAFPVPSGHVRAKGYQAGKGEYEYAVEVSTGGMSLRDYFAAALLPQAYASYESTGQFHSGWRRGIARDCYLMADAMLTERNDDRADYKDE